MSGWSAPQVFIGDAVPNQLVIATKRSFATAWIGTARVPPRTAAIVGYGLPTEGTLRLVAGLVRQSHARACFIGDLDPLDLSVYAAYRSGDSDLGGNPRLATALEYKGINDSWLELCERSFRPGFDLDDVCIEMGLVERRHLDVLEALIDVEKLVGPRSSELLASGFKLEVEGASNPAFYRPGFATRLRRHLLD